MLRQLVVSFSPRRRKTAAERRAQRLRARARLTQSWLDQLETLSQRGSILSEVGASLKVVLQRDCSHFVDSRTVPDWWHHRQKLCKLGDVCTSAHPTPCACSPTSVVDHTYEHVVKFIPAQALSKGTLKSTAYGVNPSQHGGSGLIARVVRRKVVRATTSVVRCVE